MRRALAPVAVLVALGTLTACSPGMMPLPMDDGGTNDASDGGSVVLDTECGTTPQIAEEVKNATGALDAKTVASLAKAAGFPDAEIPTAAAVAAAESGLTPKATNNNTNGSTDYGLWQINSIHASVLSQGTWSDPEDNAGMAFKIWQQAGNSWQPWVTFNTGAYKKHMNVEVKAEVPDCTPPKVAAATACKTKTTNFSGFENGLIPQDMLCPLWANPNLFLRADAAGGFEALSKAYQKEFGEKPCVTDGYRDLASQIDVKQRKPNLAAKPGTSDHGWGLAVDMCGGIENFGTPQHNWMVQEGPKYGWTHPSWARANGSKPEPWHHYFGTDDQASGREPAAGT